MSSNAARVSWPRFDLKTLLLAFAAVAILLTPAHWFGVPYLVSVGFSSALVVGCITAYGQDHSWPAFGVAMLWLVFAVVLSMIVMVFFGHAFFNAVACLLLAPCKLRRKNYARVLIAVGVGFYAITLWHGAARVRELLAYKAKFPVVSLEERLAFEKDDLSRHDSTAGAVPLSPAILANLSQQEEFVHGELGYGSRSWALRELHENIHQQFVGAAGFGIARMMYVSPWSMERERSLGFESQIRGPEPFADKLDSTHQAASLDFVNASQWGYLRSPQAVAGFEPHGFASNREDWNEEPGLADRWQVTRLELVSLLRHDEPRVYISDRLPQMAALAGLEHRPLNAFEKSALTKLKTTELIVINRKPTRIEMLGAIRAGTNCLECHEGARGKLLGAFSYSIQQSGEEDSID